MHFEYSHTVFPVQFTAADYSTRAFNDKETRYRPFAVRSNAGFMTSRYGKSGEPWQNTAES